MQKGALSHTELPTRFLLVESCVANMYLTEPLVNTAALAGPYGRSSKVVVPTFVPL